MHSKLNAPTKRHLEKEIEMNAIKVKRPTPRGFSSIYATANAEGRTASEIFRAAKIHLKKFPKDNLGVYFFVQEDEIFNHMENGGRFNHSDFPPPTALQKELCEKYGGKVYPGRNDGFVDCEIDGVYFTVGVPHRQGV